MKYCKHLKKRKNKPYCKLLDKEITLSECNKINSNNKCREYKNDIKISNNNQISNSAKALHNSANNCRRMKNKSNKLARIERKRKSVFTDDLKHCYLCGNKKDDLHEPLGGRNRLNCIRLGYIIPVCRLCHSRIQDDNEFKMYCAKKVQIHYEENIGSRNEFISIFRRNYL